MKELAITIFILLQTTFTPIDAPRPHNTIRMLGVFSSANLDGEKQAADKCIEQLDAEYAKSKDLANESFGCVMVEHPSNPKSKQEHKHEGSH
jgi:hypothetical protein